MTMDREQLKEMLVQLKTEHRDLDEALVRLQEQEGAVDMLSMQRMKKRKLALRDMIAKLESMLIDDIIA